MGMMVNARHVGPNQLASVRFGRKMSAAELADMRPMLDEIPALKALGGYDIKPEFCATMTMPQNPQWNWTRAFEAIADRVRMAWNVRSHWKQELQWPDLALSTGVAVNIQRVTIPVNSPLVTKGDTWAVSDPCARKTCPTLRDGSPATGRAIKGTTMINWIINERPQPVGQEREAANPL